MPTYSTKTDNGILIYNTVHNTVYIYTKGGVNEPPITALVVTTKLCAAAKRNIGWEN